MTSTNRNPQEKEKMTLTSLLKRIPPLPWLLVTATDGDKWIGTKEGDDRITTLDGNTRSLDHVYLVHAAKVLPELIAAVKHLQENWERNLTEPMARLSKALAKAENVSEREPIESSDHQAFTVQMARTSHLCSAHLTYGDCCRIAQAIGLSLGEYEGRDNDGRGLAFTFCGGQLNNGHEAEPWIARMNGWPVKDIADEALRRKAVKKVGRWAWQWIEPNTTGKRT
jgi:hypothetical protein